MTISYTEIILSMLWDKPLTSLEVAERVNRQYPDPEGLWCYRDAAMRLYHLKRRKRVRENGDRPNPLRPGRRLPCYEAVR